MTNSDEKRQLQNKISRTLNSWFSLNPHYDGFGIRPEQVSFDASGRTIDAYLKVSPKKLNGMSLENLNNLKETDMWGFSIVAIDFVYEDRTMYLWVMLSKKTE